MVEDKVSAFTFAAGSHLSTDDYSAIYVTITEVSLLPGPVVIYESSEGKEINLLEHRDNNINKVPNPPVIKHPVVKVPKYPRSEKSKPNLHQSLLHPAKMKG